MSTQNFKRSNNKEMRYNIKIEKNNNKKIYKKGVIKESVLNIFGIVKKVSTRRF